MSLDHTGYRLTARHAGCAARRVLAPLLLTAAAAAATAAPSAADEAWTRHEGTAPQTAPHGLRCSDAVVIGGRQVALVCHAPGRSGVGLHIASGSAATAPLQRLETGTGAFKVLLTLYTPAEGAPGCPPAAAVRCTAGVVLADVYDETCMGTVVLAVDPSGRVRRAGHISEVLARNGETACTGREAAVRASPAGAVAITLVGDAVRQTPAGRYVSAGRRPVVYELRGGLLRKR